MPTPSWTGSCTTRSGSTWARPTCGSAADRPVAIKKHRGQCRPRCPSAISAALFRDIQQCSSEQILNRGSAPRRRRRRLPHRVRPRLPNGRRGLGLGALAVVGRGHPLLQAGRGDEPVQDLLGRRAADRVGRPGGAGQGGRLRLVALARLGLRGRLRHRVRVGAGARRTQRQEDRGQRGLALPTQRHPGAEVAALIYGIIIN